MKKTSQRAARVISALLCLVVGPLLPAVELPVGALFECPESVGLCELERSGHWRPWWTGAGAESLFEYQVGTQGHVVVRLAAHQWEGELLVLEPAGNVALRRLLGAARPLSALTGWLDDGTPVLCNDTHREALCDVIVGSPRQPVDPLSPGCLFPRFSSAGAASCLRERDSRIVTRDEEGRWVSRAVELPRSIVVEYQALASGEALLVALPNLYRLAPGSTRPTVVDRIWRTWFSRGSFFWARCEQADTVTARAPCTLHREANGHQSSRSWELGFVPTNVQETSAGTVMVEYRDGTSRTIVELLDGQPEAQRVWREPSPSP